MAGARLQAPPSPSALRPFLTTALTRVGCSSLPPPCCPGGKGQKPCVFPNQGFSCVCLQESGQKEPSPRPGAKLSGFFCSYGKQITHKHFGINQQQIVISHCPGGCPHCSAGHTSFQLPLGCPGKSRKGPELWLGWKNGRPAHALGLPLSAQTSGLPKDPELPCLSQSRSRLTWPLSFSVPGVRASHEGGAASRGQGLAPALEQSCQGGDHLPGHHLPTLSHGPFHLSE